jgi:hypothetical protein
VVDGPAAVNKNIDAAILPREMGVNGFDLAVLG